jgi:biotin transport system substrate-specific component
MSPVPGTVVLDPGVGAASRTARRAAAVAIAAALVAASAQAVVPLPFSPVPMTLQPLAVLVIGALLGPGLGAAALVLYLGAGAAGLPVFAPGGIPGAARLIGPTGGYLLAFPLAAAVTGAITGPGRPGVARVIGACAIGMLVIHAGGVAQLAVLGGDPALAVRVGFVPFFTGDLLKIGLAAGTVLVFGTRLRSLL